MSNKGLSAGVKIQMIGWALFMPICLVLAIWAFLPSADKDEGFDTASVAAQELRTEPVGKVNLPGEQPEVAAAAPAEAPAPKETYDTVCAACHATGLLDSPKFGDKAAWDQRIADAGGLDGLVASAIAGKGSMPPKGGSTLSDEDFAKVVSYLSGQTAE